MAGGLRYNPQTGKLEYIPNDTSEFGSDVVPGAGSGQYIDPEQAYQAGAADIQKQTEAQLEAQKQHEQDMAKAQQVAQADFAAKEKQVNAAKASLEAEKATAANELTKAKVAGPDAFQLRRSQELPEGIAGSQGLGDQPIDPYADSEEQVDPYAGTTVGEVDRLGQHIVEPVTNALEEGVDVAEAEQDVSDKQVAGQLENAFKVIDEAQQINDQAAREAFERNQSIQAERRMLDVQIAEAMKKPKVPEPSMLNLIGIALGGWLNPGGRNVAWEMTQAKLNRQAQADAEDKANKLQQFRAQRGLLADREQTDKEYGVQLAISRAQRLEGMRQHLETELTSGIYKDLSEVQKQKIRAGIHLEQGKVEVEGKKLAQEWYTDQQKLALQAKNMELRAAKGKGSGGSGGGAGKAGFGGRSLAENQSPLVYHPILGPYDPADPSTKERFKQAGYDLPDLKEIVTTNFSIPGPDGKDIRTFALDTEGKKRAVKLVNRRNLMRSALGNAKFELERVAKKRGGWDQIKDITVSKLPGLKGLESQDQKEIQSALKNFLLIDKEARNLGAALTQNELSFLVYGDFGVDNLDALMTQVSVGDLVNSLENMNLRLDEEIKLEAGSEFGVDSDIITLHDKPVARGRKAKEAPEPKVSASDLSKQVDTALEKGDMELVDSQLTGAADAIIAGETGAPSGVVKNYGDIRPDFIKAGKALRGTQGYNSWIRNAHRAKVFPKWYKPGKVKTASNKGLSFGFTVSPTVAQTKEIWEAEFALGSRLKKLGKAYEAAKKKAKKKNAPGPKPLPSGTLNR